MNEKGRGSQIIIQLPTLRVGPFSFCLNHACAWDYRVVCFALLLGDPVLGVAKSSFNCQRYALDHFHLYPSLQASLPTDINENCPVAKATGQLSIDLRRVRDSNPRKCYLQQFSRLPQSTALPTLRRKSKYATLINKKLSEQSYHYQRFSYKL